MPEFELIYQEIYRRGLVSSQYDFSRRFLLRSGSYYSVLKATNTEPSLSTLLVLADRVGNMRFEHPENTSERAYNYQNMEMESMIRRYLDKRVAGQIVECNKRN